MFDSIQGHQLDKKESGKLGGKIGGEIMRARFLKTRALCLDNPVRCKHCSSPLKFEFRLKHKFCSHSCAAKFHDHFAKIRRGPPRSKLRFFCSKCGVETNLKNGFCRTHEKHHNISLGLVAVRDTLKKWLISQRGYACERCNTAQWMAAPVPLEIDHVDGNAGNNDPSNLRVLCPNCHSQMPTSKGRNRGNGRAARGLRIS